MMTRREQLVFDRVCQQFGIQALMSNDDIREAAEAIGGGNDAQGSIDEHIPTFYANLREDLLVALERYDAEERQAGVES